MKKIINILLITILFIPVMVNAETCENDKVYIDSISVDKNSNVNEIEEATAKGKNINLTLGMSEVGDNIRYKIVVKNDSNEDYILDKNSINISSKYMDYTIESDDNNIVKKKSSKTIYLKVNYSNPVPAESFENGTFNDEINMKVNLSTNENIINPNTGIKYILYISLIVLIMIGMFIIFRKKRLSKLMILIIGLLFIPITTYALCRCDINIESKVVLKKPETKLSSFIELKLLEDASLFTDDFGNIRYSGKDVNNYVCLEKDKCNINNLYRIIGVFKNIDDGTGKKETRVKIIKATNNGKDYYDTQNRNNWARPASLNTTLQRINLADSNLIGNVLWNLGGSTNHRDNAYQYYQTERSENHYRDNPTQWIGKIALMYASDYGYASSECSHISKPLCDYDEEICTTSNWLFLGQEEWLLNHFTERPNNAISIWSNGLAMGHAWSDSSTVGENKFYYRSTAFFKANVVIDEENSGDGTIQNPYLVK